jgi:hypothetical protein
MNLGMRTLIPRTMIIVASGVIAVLSALSLAVPADSISQISGGGRVSDHLLIGLTGLGGRGLGVTSTTTGAMAVPSTETAGLIDFGELNRGSGEPVGGIIALQLRGNASYRLNISQSNFEAFALQVRNREVAASDRGSFLTLRVGNIAGTGARANVGGTVVGGDISGGIALDRISQGPVGINSTMLCRGGPPSLGGTASNTDNAVEVPVYVYAPSGLEINPARGAAQGSFQTVLQLGIFTAR